MPHLSVRADPPFTNGTVSIRSLGQFTVNKPGFVSVVDDNGADILLISEFQALGSDSIQRVDGLAGLVKSGSVSSAKTTRVGGSVTWPNDVTSAPATIFGAEGFVVGGGFLVPGKGNGGIWYSAFTANGSSTDLIKLAGKSGWFYHRVIFADIDGDGQQEMVSCRTNKPIFGSTSTMLVYLKPSDPSNPTGSWSEIEVGPGCDALFTVADLNNDGIPEVIAASYFTSELNLFVSNSSEGFSDPKSVQTVLLDNTIGAAFDVQVVDLNNDGKQELLVSNHQGGNANPSGSVYAYEIPSDITNASAYTRHTLAQNFPVTQGGLNQAAPGSPQAFYPTKASHNNPPYIVLAGDAAQIAYVLIPGTTPFSYTVTTLFNCHSTVGGIAIADVDEDGNAELYIPCYDNNFVAVFSF